MHRLVIRVDSFVVARRSFIDKIGFLSMKTLTGISWDHPRGFDPVLATAKQFNRDHPDVQIKWDKRSLHDFGAAPVEQLAHQYDLVVLDHPWAGFMSDTRCYVPMDELLPAEMLKDLAAHSAGPSHRSYEYDGHQWALAIDAATPAASYRPDLLARVGGKIPRKWDEVIELGKAAQRAGMRVAAPLGPVDSITVFLSFADNLGGKPFSDRSRVVSRECGRAVIEAMRRFIEICAPESFELTPITMMDQMSRTDELVYCPLAYQYSNYSRDGFRPHLCLYTDMPGLASEEPKGSHIGGTGLAISSKCQHRSEAAQYAAYVASGPCQRTTYFESGGQPAHTDAWEDPRVNEISHGFFKNTRRTIELSYLRPTYNGYIRVQYEGGRILRQCLMEHGDVETLLRDLDELYQQSLRGNK
jgi:multiple sugar transport system substrate-binding protein